MSITGTEKDRETANMLCMIVFWPLVAAESRFQSMKQPQINPSV